MGPEARETPRLHPRAPGSIIHNRQDVGGQTHKMWSVHAMEYYSALNRKEILEYVTMQMNLKDIMPAETSRSQKDKYYMITYMII